MQELQEDLKLILKKLNKIKCMSVERNRKQDFKKGK